MEFNESEKVYNLSYFLLIISSYKNVRKKVVQYVEFIESEKIVQNLPLFFELVTIDTF